MITPYEWFVEIFSECKTDWIRLRRCVTRRLPCDPSFQLSHRDSSNSLKLFSTWAKSPPRAMHRPLFAPASYWSSAQRLVRTWSGPSSMLVSKTELGTRTEFRIRIYCNQDVQNVYRMPLAIISTYIKTSFFLKPYCVTIHSNRILETIKKKGSPMGIGL